MAAEAQQPGTLPIGIVSNYVPHVPPTGVKHYYPLHPLEGEAADWGSVTVDTHPYIDPVIDDAHPKKHLLDQFRATSIAGNDLIASVLYTIGTCTTQAGQYAPISLILVCIALWPFRGIYGEVGTALPLNGGSYNCLLNATSKLIACVAASLSFLSYTATAVVSAASATSYVAGEFENFDPFWLTIGVLAFFAFITLLGMRDSSFVAITIFAAHAITLCILIVACFVKMIENKGHILSQNYHLPMDNPIKQIYLGFCTGLLGITGAYQILAPDRVFISVALTLSPAPPNIHSTTHYLHWIAGFETSANYIEQQKPGVFPKTMKNMWWLVLFFNPTIGLLSVAVMPVPKMLAR